MTVRDTSAESHALNPQEQKKAAVLQYVVDHGPCTRREVATRLGFETATVSGIVKPFLDTGTLYECGKMVCRINGNNSYALEAKPVQHDFFRG